MCLVSLFVIFFFFKFNLKSMKRTYSLDSIRDLTKKYKKKEGINIFHFKNYNPHFTRLPLC
jgi:hypothetical protein